VWPKEPTLLELRCGSEGMLGNVWVVYSSPNIIGENFASNKHARRGVKERLVIASYGLLFGPACPLLYICCTSR